jgi:hypothetical protein
MSVAIETVMRASPPMEFGSGYFPVALDPERVRRLARKRLKKIEFDTVVGAGFSGLLPLGIVARSFKVNMLAVRKEIDRQHSHCSSLLEGSIGYKWLFVDDFPCTGRTFSRVYRTIDKHCMSRNRPHQCVGAFFYEKDGRVDSLEELMFEFPRIKMAVNREEDPTQ